MKVESIKIGTRFNIYGNEFTVLRTGSDTCLVLEATSGKRSEMKNTTIFGKELIAE